MKVVLLAAAVFIGGFMMAKVTLEFVDLLVQKLKEEDKDNY